MLFPPTQQDGGACACCLLNVIEILPTKFKVLHFNPVTCLYLFRYEEPYKAGAELYGCGGGGSKFAETPAMEVEQLAGSWQAVSGGSFSCSEGEVHRDAAEQLPPQLLAAGADGVVGLPLGAFSRVTVAHGDNVCVEAGMLVEEGRARVVARRQYTSGKLARIMLGHEKKQT